MKLKNILPSKIKNSLLLTTIVLISSLLFSSQTDSNYLNNFFDDIVGSISADKTEVCINEPATITFKAENGTAPYTFTYSENGVEKPTVTSEVDGAYSFSYKNSTPDDYVFILTKVVDKDGTSQSITGEQVVIKVNTPPTAVFTFNNDNSCSGETIKFTNSSTGEGNLSYNWDFGDSKTSPQKEPTHIFEALGCGTETFPVKLTVTDENGCSASITKDIGVQEKPDIDFGDSSGSGFSNCSNSPSPTNPNYQINILNLSEDKSCIETYEIEWGDGNSLSINAEDFETSLDYEYTQTGVFNLKVKAIASNGCENEKTYQIKNVSTPAGGFEADGNTADLCPSNPALKFGITNFEENSDDSIYIVDYGDGTTPERYSHSEVSAGLNLSHQYTTPSCNQPNNQFIAKLTIENACTSRNWTVDNITVLDESEAKFDAPDKACVNKSINFINQSVIGDKIGCDGKLVSFLWDFGDGSTDNNFLTSSLENQSHTYTSPGTYTITLKLQGKCIGIDKDIFTKEICIEPEITPTFSVDNEEGCIPFAVAVTNTADKTDLCSEPSYLWSVSYTSLNCGTSSDWEFTNGTDKNSENPQFLFKNSGKYTIIQRVTTGCGTETTTKTIDVKKSPTVSINNIDDACGNLTVTPTATIENCTTDTSALTYHWTFSGGSPATATTLNPGNIEFTTPGIHTITLEVTNDCGVSNTATEEFTLSETPIITNADLTQEICSGQNTSEIIFTSNNANTTYSWSAVASSGITGFIPSGTSNTIPSQVLINTQNSTKTVIYTVIPSLNGCDGDAVDFVITVNPAPIITTHPISSEICLDGTATELEVEFQNGAGTASYQWYSKTVDNASTGTLIAGATNPTYNAPTNTVGTTYYYAVISFTSGGCSEIKSNTAAVKVVEQLTIKTITTPQTICLGGAVNALEFSVDGGTGTATYQWFSNTTNSITGGTKITGATNSKYTPSSFSTAGTFYFYAEISLDGNGCSSANSAVFQIEVVPDPVIDAQAIATQELCQSSTPEDLIVTVSGGTTTQKTYQWYVNTDSATDGSSVVSGATSATYTPPTDTVGSLYYYVVVTQAESGCAVESDISHVKVNESPIISKQPISSEICLDGTATELEIAYANGTGTASYQWYSNIVDDASTGTFITGETNTTYNPPTNTVGTTYYYAVISFTSGGCSEIISTTATVKVVEQLTVNPISAPQTVCIGGTANEMEVTFSGGTGNATYQWFSNSSNSITGGTKITGANNSKYTPLSFSTEGTLYFYAEVSLDGNGCSSNNSEVFQIEVVPDPIIDTQPIASQELCQNSIPKDLTVVVSGGTTSTKTYQWYQNNTNSNSGGTLIPGEVSATFTPNTTNVGTFYYYVMVSQPEAGCSITSAISTLIVNTAPTFSKQPISSEICLDGTATELEVEFQNGAGTASYQWYSNTVDNASTGTLITGETNATYNAPTNTVGITYYYAVISFSSGGCSEIISTTATVKVVEQLTIDPISAAQTLCIGGTANEFEVTFSGGTGTPSYQWFSNTSAFNTGGTMIGGATNSKYTPSSFSAAGNFYYYAEISLDGNGCSSANSAAFQIEVVPDPVIDTQPIATQELCQNSIPEDLIVVVSGGTTSTKTYQWYQNNTNSNSGGTLIPGEVSATFTPNTTNVGTFYYYVMVSQPEAGCSITSAISTLIVNTAPTFSKQPISSEICLDGTATELEVEFQNGAGTASYQWYSNTVDNASTGTLITGETNATYNAPTNTVGTTYYYAVISFTSGGCSEIISDTAHIIVNEIPVINNAEITVYSEITFNFDPSSIAGNVVPNGTKYTWSSPTFNPAGSILGSSAAATPQDQISQTLENTGTSPIIVTYLITAATTKCIGDSFTLEVTVNPSINSNAIVTNNNCFESNDGSISTKIEGGVPFETGNPYLISWSGPNGFTSTNTTITNLEVGSYIIIIEDKSGFTFTEEFNITQPTILTIVKDLEKDISCFQGNDGAIAVTISGGTLPYTYHWTTTDGSGIVPNSENQNLLTAGNYTLEITDKNNCTTSTNIILTEPEGLKIETAFKQDILCFGDATGAVEITVSGGTKIEISSGVFDYLYSWSGPNGFTSSSKNISNLITGTYTLAVTDALGCTTNTSIIINQSSEIKINYTKTDVTCYGETNGAIDITVIGGVAPYKISWSNLANGFSQSNLSAGTYVATITDGNNCIAQVSIPIEQPLFFIAPAVSPISCNGANDGSINLHLTGGISPIFITWSDDASAGVERNNLAAGTYTVVVLDSDANQCPIEQTFTFTNPPEIAVSSTVTDAIDCTIVNSGHIDLTVAGGTAPYSYNWSTGENTEDLENIPPGDYSVEITDANGCKVNRQFTIFRQDPILIDFVTSTITDCDIKTVSQKTEAKVTGGFLPYTYSWSSGTISGSDNRFMTTSQNGSYTLTVTDSKGCSESKSFLINLPTIGNPDFRYRAFALDTYDLLSIEDPIQFTNLSSGNYTNITWDFGDGSPISKEENPIHTYDTIGTFKIKLTVEYDAGCTYIVERTVTITLGYSLVNPTAFTPNGDGYNETIRPNFNGFIEVEMNIYDSWGTLVFYEKGITLQGWNGLIKNAPAENGNYIMVVKGLTFYKKEIITTTPVTLLK